MPLPAPVITASAASRPAIAQRQAAARSGLLFARQDAATQPPAPHATDAVRGAEPVMGIPAMAPLREAEPASMESTWTMYKLTRGSSERERLILHFSPLVELVASRLGMRLPSTVEHSDLVSYGMFGLIDAIDKFDIERDVKFETYAQARIRGAILDGLRAADWIPRSVRSKARTLDRALGELEARFHRTPTRAELAEHLQVTVAEVHQIESQHLSGNVLALDEMLAGGDRIEQRFLVTGTRGDRPRDPALAFEDKEIRRVLAEAIALLGARDRLMLVLYYFERLTLSEIGRVLGVTESRVSQIHSGAMRVLQETLRASLPR